MWLLRALICTNTSSPCSLFPSPELAEFPRGWTHSKDDDFWWGLVLFITTGRLEQASGETFWQRFSTSALCLPRMMKDLLCDLRTALTLFFHPFLWENELMAPCSFPFLLRLSLCVTSGPSRPIPSRFHGIPEYPEQSHGLGSG